MGIIIREERGYHFGEGLPERPLIKHVEESGTLIELCYAHTIDRLLLYPKNLPPAFFDLSSGEAGAILQTLRNYHVRLAVVRSPALRLSSRFGELLTEEERGPYFRLFDERAAALAWLCST